MRPLGPQGYLLMLTGPSLSQVRECAFFTLFVVVLGYDVLTVEHACRKI